MNGRWGPSGQREPFDEPVDEPFDEPFDEPPVAECADTIGKLLDLQRQACEKLNDATMQALCVLPLAQCLRSGSTLPEEPQSDVLPIKHVLPHASQAAMHAAAHVAAQAAPKVEARVVPSNNHMKNRTELGKTHGTVPVATDETRHGQVTAEGAETKSNVEPVPISERNPGPGTCTEIWDFCREI